MDASDDWYEVDAASKARRRAMAGSNGAVSAHYARILDEVDSAASVGWMHINVEKPPDAVVERLRASGFAVSRAPRDYWRGAMVRVEWTPND